MLQLRPGRSVHHPAALVPVELPLKLKYRAGVRSKIPSVTNSVAGAFLRQILHEGYFSAPIPRKLKLDTSCASISAFMRSL